MRAGLTLYFVRHGETDWNAERRYQGQRDIPINARGRAQARRNGEALRTLLPALKDAEFLSSPLGRARETMEIVRQTLGLDPSDYRIEERLKELSYGAWEGALQDELPRIDPMGVAARARDPYHWRPQGGESYADLMARTIRWLQTLERDTIVVSHGGLARCVHGFIAGIDVSRVPTLDCPQDRVMVVRRGAIDWV